MKSMLNVFLATTMKFVNVCQLVNKAEIVSYYNNKEQSAL